MPLESEDVPQLSAETFLVLQEFYKEQEEREKRSVLTLPSDSDVVIDEDWQLSQFWYDTTTIEKLVEIALKTVNNKGRIALISCPTLYKPIKAGISDRGEVHLFEFDKRFAIYGEDYVPYDYKSPLDVPREKSSHYDLVVADPPFLSDECLTKTAVTIKFLAKNHIVLCTGATMAELAERLLDLKKTNFKPGHRNNLANEFWCYANYDITRFL